MKGTLGTSNSSQELEATVSSCVKRDYHQKNLTECIARVGWECVDKQHFAKKTHKKICIHVAVVPTELGLFYVVKSVLDLDPGLAG